jgi:TolC family type I secretion outer membrane protein
MNRTGYFLITILLAVTGIGWQGSAWAAESMPGKIDLENVQVLDLATAARIAVADNPTLAVAQARVEQARQALNQARAAYWPRVDLAASGTRLTLSDKDYQTQSTLYGSYYQTYYGKSYDQSQDYYKASLTASWLLFDGFARKFNVAAATYGEQSVAAAMDDSRRLLLQAVAGAFLGTQLSLENIAIAKADEAFNQRQLTEAKLRYDVGTGALSDVLNFEVKVNTAQSNRIVAEKTYQTDRIALAALLGVPQANLPEHTQLAPLEAVTAARMQTPDLDKMLEVALAQRPDLTQTDRAVQQAEAAAKAKKADYYFPTLSLVGSYDGERTDDLGFRSEDFGNSVGLALSYNIFAGGLYKAQYHQARARLTEAEKSRQDIEINIASQVHTNIEGVLSAQKQFVLQRKNADLVQKNRDLVEKEYKAGVGSLVRLNEAQRDLIAAQVQLALAQTTLHQAWYDLWSATGHILTEFTP